MLNGKSRVPAHFEKDPGFLSHCPTAQMADAVQFEHSPGPCPSRGAYHSLELVKAAPEEQMGGRTQRKPFLKTSCCFILASSEGDVIYHLSYAFRYYKSKMLSSHETLFLLYKYFS